MLSNYSTLKTVSLGFALLSTVSGVALASSSDEVQPDIRQSANFSSFKAHFEEKKSGTSSQTQEATEKDQDLKQVNSVSGLKKSLDAKAASAVQTIAQQIIEEETEKQKANLEKIRQDVEAQKLQMQQQKEREKQNQNEELKKIKEDTAISHEALNKAKGVITFQWFWGHNPGTEENDEVSPAANVNPENQPVQQSQTTTQQTREVRAAELFQQLMQNDGTNNLAVHLKDEVQQKSQELLKKKQPEITRKVAESMKPLEQNLQYELEKSKAELEAFQKQLNAELEKELSNQWMSFSKFKGWFSWSSTSDNPQTPTVANPLQAGNFSAIDAFVPSIQAISKATFEGNEESVFRGTIELANKTWNIQVRTYTPKRLDAPKIATLQELISSQDKVWKFIPKNGNNKHEMYASKNPHTFEFQLQSNTWRNMANPYKYGFMTLTDPGTEIEDQNVSG